MIKKAKDEPTFTSVSRVIKIIKQIFNTPEGGDVEPGQKGEKQPVKKDSLASALNSVEYKAIFDFFVSEVAGLVL